MMHTINGSSTLDFSCPVVRLFIFWNKFSLFPTLWYLQDSVIKNIQVKMALGARLRLISPAHSVVM